jgi:hypothetical protein
MVVISFAFFSQIIGFLNIIYTTPLTGPYIMSLKVCMFSLYSKLRGSDMFLKVCLLCNWADVSFKDTFSKITDIFLERPIDCNSSYYIMIEYAM